VISKNLFYILDLPKAVEYSRFTANNAFETQAGIGEEPGNACGLLSLLCGPFLKGTPFEEQLGMNDQSNKRLIDDNPSGNRGILSRETTTPNNIFNVIFIIYSHSG